MSSRTQQCFNACAALSALLTSHNVPHAFSGAFLTVALGAEPREIEEIYCVAPGYRAVRQACTDNEILATTLAPWSSRLYVTYTESIPPVQIEIVPAGEEGPRNLDTTTIMAIKGIPFLSVTEFIRAKLRVWISRQEPQDALDVLFVVTRFWEAIDINRINEPEMESFVEQVPEARTAWGAIRKRYGM